MDNMKGYGNKVREEIISGNAADSSVYAASKVNERIDVREKSKRQLWDEKIDEGCTPIWLTRKNERGYQITYWSQCLLFEGGFCTSENRRNFWSFELKL